MPTPRTTRNVIVACVAIAGFLAALAGAVAFVVVIVWNAASRIQVNPITIDPQAISTAMKEAVVTTLKEGQPAQRLEMINTLRDMGTDAKDFVPHLIALLADADPQIQTAAAEALKKIDPDAAAKAGVK